jgi:hypothetical protein
MVASTVAATTPSSRLIPRSAQPFLTEQQQSVAALSMQTAGRRFPDTPTVTVLSHPGFFAAALPGNAWSVTSVEDLNPADRLQSSAWLAEVDPTPRTSDGALVRFPWLQQHRGQIFSMPSQRTQHPLDRLVNLGLDNASADGARGAKHPAVKAWKSFVADEFGSTPARPMDCSAPLWAKLQEEMLAMRFVSALVEYRGISVDSAAVYWSAVQGWHARSYGVKIGGGLKFERLPNMLKGLRRVLGQTPKRIRRGIAPQALRKAMDLCLDPRDPDDANVRAALSVALLGLLRSSEFALDGGKAWRADRQVARGDIVELTPERMTLMIAPCKNKAHLSGKTCALVIGGGGAYIDACAEVLNMLRVDPLLPGQDPSKVPLFRKAGTVEPLRTGQVMSITRRLMLSIGEDASQFGTHSYRIGGATALFAAGADETVIRTMGRWCSDIHQLYLRACYERCCEWTRKCGSTSVTDVALTFDEVDDY